MASLAAFGFYNPLRVYGCMLLPGAMIRFAMFHGSTTLGFSLVNIYHDEHHQRSKLPLLL